jgi:hypothetical protein
MSLCPNCQKPLPDPPESFCPSCGAVLGAGRASALPAAAGGSIPWEEREQRGFFGAFFENTKEVLTGPTSFFRRMPVEGGIPSPLLYGVLVGYIGLVAQAVYSTILRTMFGSTLAALGGSGEGRQVLALMQGGAGLVIQIVLGPIQVIVGLFLTSAIYHLMLMLFGGARRGFEATFRVVCFAHAASLLGIIPVCGFLAGLYVLVLNVIGLAEAHGISRGKAAAAVLVPILLVCCCCAAALGIMFGGIAGLASQLGR